MSGRHPARTILFITILMFSSILVFTSPASASTWTKIDMGKPYDGQNSKGLMGIAVGDGDRDNWTEAYSICGDNGHLFQFKLGENGWSDEDIATLGGQIYSNAIAFGDADDDGDKEVYVRGCSASYSDYQPAYGHIYQVENTSEGWKVGDCGATGWDCNDLSIGDGDNDGRKELYSADADGHIYQYSMANGWRSNDIGVTPNSDPTTNAPMMYSVAIGDGDNDGVAEVYGGGGDFHIYRFDFNGFSWNRTDIGTPNSSYTRDVEITDIVIGDGDHDGKNEVFGSSRQEGSIWCYKWINDSIGWNISKIISSDWNNGPTMLCFGVGPYGVTSELYAIIVHPDKPPKQTTYELVETRYNAMSQTWESTTMDSGDGWLTGIASGTINAASMMTEVFVASRDSHAYEFFNDNVPPANPIVWSDTHGETGSWYQNNRVHILWKDIGYDRSGIDGYSVEWDGNAITIPDKIKDHEQNVNDLNTTLPDGSWYFHIRSCDKALNWNASATHYGPIGIDTTPPESVKVCIDNDAFYTNAPMVTLSVTASDPFPGSGVAWMAFSNDGSSWSDWEPFSANRPGWNITETLYGGNATDGAKYVHIKVMDAAGNELPVSGRSNDSILLDRVSPENLAISIEADANYTSSPEVILYLDAHDPEPASGLWQMTFSNDGIAWSEWQDWKGQANWSLVTDASGSGSDGNRTVLMRVKDQAGNQAGPVMDSIILDREAPGNFSITINNGAEYTNNSTVDLELIAIDPNPGPDPAEMALANDPGSLMTWEDFAHAKTGWNLTSGPGGTDFDGNKSVYLKVRDLAGNAVGPVQDGIFLDRVKPKAVAITINGGANYTTDTVVNLAFDADDQEPSSGISLMQFSGDGDAWTDWEQYAVQRNYTLQKPDGMKTVFFRIQDRAGNIGDSISASITLDTAPPVLSNVRVVGITDTAAIITWSSDEESSSAVYYGLTAAYGSSKMEPAFVTSHIILLSGLAPSTIYHFSVYSRDRAGNPGAFGGDYRFITLATPDRDPPIISDVQVLGITDHLAVVSWNTNEPSNSMVHFWIVTTDSQIIRKGSFVLRHGVTLEKLAPGTTYHFLVESTDPAGNGPSRSGDFSFTTLKTPDTTPPAISNVKVTAITDRAAVITWETDEPADGFVDYGITTAYSFTVRNTLRSIFHETTLISLGPSTTYHFRVRMTDATGNGPSISGDFMFTTTAMPDNEPPSIFGLRVEAITDTRAIVLWETSEAADSYLEYGPSSSYGFSAMVWEYTLQHSLSLRGLTPDTTYHLRVRSADPSGNPGTSGDYTIRTKKNASAPDTTPPVISGLTVAGVTDTCAVVIWTTDEPADGTVRYGIGATYGLRAGSPAYSLIHSILLEDLSPGTEYHLRVESLDAYGNGPSQSGDMMFTTGTSPDITPPRISDVKVTNVTDTSAVISWTTDEPASSVIEYGTTLFYDRNLTSRLYLFNHTITLTGLSPSTKYHFRVSSVDPSANVAQLGPDQSFTTRKTGSGPDTNTPGKPTVGEFTWILAATIVIIAASLIGLVFAIRHARKKPPMMESQEIRNRTLTEPEAEANRLAERGGQEEIETIDMDVPEDC